MNLSIIDGLYLDEEGVLTNSNQDSVHLRQGDMDGACGPYCLVMALLALGVVSRSDITAQNGVDYRTRTGKLLKEILNLRDPLVLAGTTSEQLHNMLAAFNATSIERYADRPANVLGRVRELIESGCPVIIDVRSKKEDGLNHWTLAIGVCDEFIYLLDPGYELATSSYWNAAISAKPNSTRFGYRYINPHLSANVEVEEMLAVIPAKNKHPSEKSYGTADE